MTRTIAITGGATGIGAATVDALRRAGHTVWVLDVARPERDDVGFVHCDLSDAGAIDQAVDALPAAIDALVQVAGVADSRPPERTLAINFLGLRHLTERALPRVVAGGDIVLVASTAGRDWQRREAEVRELLATPSFEAGLAWCRANTAVWDANPYKFSKQCAAAYTYTATGAALPRGVRVNCVNPGSTETRLTPTFREIVGHALYDWGVAQIGRHGTAAEVAEVIAFLASGTCRWLNGVEIVVDGGYIAGILGGWIRPAEAAAGLGSSTPPSAATPTDRE